MDTNAPCQIMLGQVVTGELIKISGTIRHYTCGRGEASFVLTRRDKARMGMVSVALAVAGMGGQAIATASNAATLQEEADYVEFDLDGKKVKGWLWRSPFKEGDVVDAAVAWQGHYFELVALANASKAIRQRWARSSSVIKSI